MFAGTPDAMSWPAVVMRVCTYAACAGVTRVKVCENGRNGAPMLTLEVRGPITSDVKKPDSCRRRCSNARKPNVLSLSSGKPSDAPYCARVNGGFFEGSLSMTGAKGLRDCMDLCRMNPKMSPRTSFVPDFVTTLTTPPAVRPNSGAKEFVTT